MEESPSTSTSDFAVFQRKWVNSAVMIFFIVAILGTLMRFIYVRPVLFLDYKNILHAHSHVSMLGWAFMLITGALIFFVLKDITGIKLKRYYRVFILNLISVTGMLVFFTLQGYGPLSICFSMLHIFTAYLFGYYIYRDMKKLPKMTGITLIKWALFWMILSTFGIWVVGAIIGITGNSGTYFYMAVQFFLHFQFNGWFTYAVLGIWSHRIEKEYPGWSIPRSYIRMLHLSLVLTYALSITWSNPLSIIFYLNSAGVLLQAVAFYLMFRKIFQQVNPFKNRNNWIDWLFVVGVLCLMIKVIVQVAVALPVIAEISYTIRNYVIGFIHLIMLGSVTLPLVAILLKENILIKNPVTHTGWRIFAAGFVLKELFLFGQGTLLWLKKGFIPYYHELILGVTVLLPVALFMVLIGQLTHKQVKTITLTKL